MLTRDECVNRIICYLKEYVLPDPNIELPLDESLIAAGIIDSYAIVDIINFIETEFNVTIEDEYITAEQFGSLNKMGTLIVKLCG